MGQSYLGELVDAAATIMELDRVEGSLTDKRDWKAAKAQYEAQVARFNKLRDEYVDTILKADNDRSQAADDVRQQLAEIREGADPSWHPAIDYTSDNLLPKLTKEAARDPRLRKALKLAPSVAGAAAVIVYFGVKLYSEVNVTDPIETRSGIEQRAAAAEKAIRYDDLMGTHVRRGGWVKGILFWPIKPSELEIASAGEFVSLVLEAQGHAEGCGSVVGYGDTLSEQQLQMVDEVANVIRDRETTWDEYPPQTVVHALERLETC